MDIRNELNIELPRARGAYLEEIPDRVWTEPGWVIEPKLDGTRESLQIGATESLLVGRNREGFLKGVKQAGGFQVHQHPVLSHIACPELDGTVLDGELTMHFMQDGQYDENTKVREKAGVFIGFTVWQALFFKGEDLRDRTDWFRRDAAAKAVSLLASPHIRLVDRFPATREKLQEIWDAGEEGAVLKLSTAPLNPGQRTCSTWWKAKAQKGGLDAFITGFSEGKSGGSGVRGVKATPNGKFATFTLSMYRDGKIVPVAKVGNLPAEAAHDAVTTFKDKYELRVVEFSASNWGGKAFRWPRFVRWREDKSPADCQFAEQVTGGVPCSC